VDCEKFLKKFLAILVALSTVFIAVPAHALDTQNGEGVFIVAGSEINLVARTSNIPVQIKNVFDSDVVVQVHVQPTNPRVVVPTAVEIKVPGNTSVTAKVPVIAVANGGVMLKVWLSTFSGQALGKPTFLHMNVNADIELTMLLGFGGAILTLFGFGIARQLRKSRRKHAMQVIAGDA
jgi:hypothetical protein